MMYLLDTTHCIDLLNAKPYMAATIDKLGSSMLSTCIITQAELIYGALISERAAENLDDIVEFLGNLIVYDLNPDTAIVYAKLKSAILNHFIPKVKGKRRNTNIGALGFKDNDLWIASVAIQYDLVLVSKDSHILRLNGIEGLKVENWEI
jgi:tRNA(fMet)-specific endonuclease VapC